MPGKASLYGSFFVYSDREEVQDVEKLEEMDQKAEVFENDIELYLHMFCESHGIENEYDIYPSQWNAALKYIYNHVIKNNPDILTIPHTVSNSYNLNAVNELLDIYIFMCYCHNQEISIQGFSFISGISRDTIHSWGNSSTRAYIYKDLQGNIINNMALSNLKEDEYVKEPSTAASDIYKKLVANNEESLVCLMKDRRYNPMKFLPILNKRHGWNLPGVSKEQTGKRALSASELPKLDAKYAAETKEYAQIEDKN